MPRLTEFRLGFRNDCERDERREREALVPSRSRVEFIQQWPVRRIKTAWWRWLRDTEMVVGRNESVHVHKDREKRKICHSEDS